MSKTQERIHELEAKYSRLLTERDHATGADRYLAEKELKATRKMIIKLHGKSIAEEIQGQIPDMVKHALAGVTAQVTELRKQAGMKVNADEKPRDERIAEALHVVKSNLFSIEMDELTDIRDRILKAIESRNQAAEQNKLADMTVNANHVGAPDAASYFDPNLPKEIADYIDPPLPPEIEAHFAETKTVAGIDLDSYFQGNNEAAGIDLDEYFLPSKHYSVSKD
ncbi:hypothetical protein ACUOIJ_21030 [Escherichia coli]